MGQSDIQKKLLQFSKAIGNYKLSLSEYAREIWASRMFQGGDTLETSEPNFQQLFRKINIAKWLMDKQKAVTIFEVSGSVLAMIYALLIASNTGNEVLGFSLLLLSALLFTAWGYIDKRWAFLALQFFYAASAIIGLVRWGWFGIKSKTGAQRQDQRS